MSRKRSRGCPLAIQLSESVMSLSETDFADYTDGWDNDLPPPGNSFYRDPSGSWGPGELREPGGQGDFQVGRKPFTQKGGHEGDLPPDRWRKDLSVASTTEKRTSICIFPVQRRRGQVKGIAGPQADGMVGNRTLMNSKEVWAWE